MYPYTLSSLCACVSSFLPLLVKVLHPPGQRLSYMFSKYLAHTGYYDLNNYNTTPMRCEHLTTSLQMGKLKIQSLISKDGLK